MTSVALHAGGGSIVLEPARQSAPLWRHCGLRVIADGLPPLVQTRVAASYSLDRDCPLTSAPMPATGWFGPLVVIVRRDSVVLPVIWTDTSVDADDQTIRVACRGAGIELVQTFRVDAELGWRIGAELTNHGAAPVTLDWLASVMVPLPATADRVISWRGRHNAELVELVEPLPGQTWLRETRRGISGHGGAPGVYVLDAGAGWHAGQALAMQLCWSGDSRIAIERDDEGFHILSAGAVLQPGEVVLAQGESWTAPDALLAISGAGRNGAMAAQHAMVRAMLRWPGGEMAPRKVHLNSWEACYFDHDATRIEMLARAAADVGIERFVLDDGWFNGRNDDRAGLGDWTPDAVKYPQGLRPLAEAVRALGMEFGLWVEPEMVNPDSDLYRAHPDWALHGDDAPLTSRGQLVLDMRRADVRDYLFDALDAVLRAAPIGYLKWDHNRDLVPAGGAEQVRGTYALLARLRAAHPTVEIESCAGGGGRSDAGMVPYVHRFWTSDNIDAVGRVAMQRGFLAFLPPEMMGSHIGASPAHATGRSQAMAFRAAVASTGHFGVELDPDALDTADRGALARWIGFARWARALAHHGGTWLGTGADGLVWQAAGSLERGVLLWVIRTVPPQDRRPQPLNLPFVDGAGELMVRLLGIAGSLAGHAAPVPALWSDAETPFTGDWLSRAGLPMPPLRAESVAIFHIVRDSDCALPLMPFPA